MKGQALFAISLFVAGAAEAAIDFDDVEIQEWVGSGENEALLVMDWKEDRQIAFGYRWGLLETATGLDMLEAVNGASDRLVRNWVDGMEFEAIFGLGWDADGDGFDYGDPDDWYEEGWFENGFWAYYSATDGEDWAFAPAGLPERTLSDGDWDGLSWAPDFSATPPMVPMVPGPAPLALILLSAVHYNRRR